MFKIFLKNNKSFFCDKNSSIFDQAKKNNITLDHSCLNARCSSCKVKVIKGNYEKIKNDLVLKENETDYILTCNTRPLSDMYLDTNDLPNDFNIKSKIFPVKIDSLKKIDNKFLILSLRFPPSANFNFMSGQYINLIHGDIKRSYSIANNFEGNKIELFIKNYDKGKMSHYLFNEAKVNDLLRIEGPLGTFYYRENEFKNIVFLATGTGIAPVKSIVEFLNKNPKLKKNKHIWIFWGVREKSDFFYENEFKNLKFIKVLSKKTSSWDGEYGYVQDVLVKQNIDLQDCSIYACGSSKMINSTLKLINNYSLPYERFYSDAFVNSN